MCVSCIEGCKISYSSCLYLCLESLTEVYFLEWTGHLKTKFNCISMGVDVLINPQNLKTFVVPPFETHKVQGPLTMWPGRPDHKPWLDNKLKGKWIHDGLLCECAHCTNACPRMKVPWEHVRPLMDGSICRHKKCLPLPCMEVDLNTYCLFEYYGWDNFTFSFVSFWFHKDILINLICFFSFCLADAISIQFVGTVYWSTGCDFAW